MLVFTLDQMGGAQYDTAVVYTVCRKLCGGGGWGWAG